MSNCNNKIGLSFTGNSKRLESFFLNCTSNNSEKSNFLGLLKHEIIEGRDYYCFVEENLEWNAEAELECRAVCRAANEAKLSFHFCYFNTDTFETVIASNNQMPYFDHDVRRLFDVSKTSVFQDMRYTTFKDWMKANFKRYELEDMLKYGAVSGFHGLIYYSETIALYEQYHPDIFELLKEDTDNQGCKSIIEFIATLNGADVQDDKGLKNLLVWYAAERIAYDIVEYEKHEEEEDDETEY